MTTLFYICAFICVCPWCYGVSTKMDFESDEESAVVEANSTKVDDQDVEVKHTIIVSTKLKNNNRRGLHNYDDGTVSTHNIASKATKDDSEEVPIINGYKSVDTTLIITPDTRRYKDQSGSQVYPDSFFINRNINDEYPNYINTPTQWKPSTHYNSINWLNQDVPLITEYNSGFINTLNSRPAYQTPGKFHRRISDDGMKEFYCKKCAELQGFRGCGSSRSNSWSYGRETTTQRIKLDGKLAKLN